MRLHDVHQGITKHKKRKRVGRGPGSGHGKTSTRGHKGQGQLAGFSQHPAFEGGRMPVFRRVPKRGFNNQWAVDVAVINVGQLEDVVDAGGEVTPEELVRHGLVKSRFDELKILGHGELAKKLTVHAHRFSATARSKIEAAGGKVVVLPGKRRASPEKSEEATGGAE